MRGQMNDDERRQTQNARMLGLQGHQRRTTLLHHLARKWGPVELLDFDEGRRAKHCDDGVDRPVMIDRDQVPVVSGEILVRDEDVTTALRRIGDDYEDARERDSDATCCGVVTLRRLTRSRLRVQDAVDRLARKGVEAAPNHIAMMGGTDKGGVSPMLTDHPLKDGRTSVGKIMVVVIDTGYAQCVGTRTDHWLDGIGPDGPRDVDELDVYNTDLRRQKDKKLDLGAGHGTFVAGVIRQLAPKSDVRMIRALDTHGVGTETQLIKALCRAGDLLSKEGRGVINISLGMESHDGQEPLGLRCALDRLPPEVVVVAAAGNRPTGVPWWPAASKRVLGVASHGGVAERLRPSEWSNRGSWVDFSAWGEGVISTFVPGEETTDNDDDTPFPPDGDIFRGKNPCAMWTGTSFAAPQVTGLLAAALAASGRRQLTRAQAQKELQGLGTLTKNYGYVLDAPRLTALQP